MAGLDLHAEAQKLAGSLSDTLNRTICNGPRLKAVIRERISGVTSSVNIGYGISRQDQDLQSGIPLTVSQKTPRLYLGFFMHLEADDAKKYMMVKESMTILALDADLSRELLHVDYQREKDRYPEAHLQVCATSADWEELAERAGLGERPLQKLHIPVGPVGGRRFRPSLEDVIEFLIVEQLVDYREGWKEEIDKTRRPFQDLQLKAAVRRNQGLAIEALEEEGWSINRPD